MCIKITVINQKGGVGKTTTAFNLAYYYSVYKQMKVVVVDMDSQGNLSTQLGAEDSEKTITDFFLGDPVQVVSIDDNLDLVPANILFAGVEMQIINRMNREKILEKLMTPIIRDYDICIVDCPPALNVITLNALAFADFTVIPLPPSIMALQGIDRMIETIMQVREELNPRLSIAGIVLTQFNPDRVESRTTLARLEKAGYSGLLFDTRISQTEKIKRAEGGKKSVFEFEKNSQPATEYAALAEEIIARVAKNKRDEQ